MAQASSLSLQGHALDRSADLHQLLAGFRQQHGLPTGAADGGVGGGAKRQRLDAAALGSSNDLQGLLEGAGGRWGRDSGLGAESLGRGRRSAGGATRLCSW